MMKKIFLTTIDNLPNQEYEVLGFVKGNTIRARHIGNDIIAGLRNLIGGEITEYTKLLREAREQAEDRMIQQALYLGANAVIGVRFETSSVMVGASELLAYGTAIKIINKKE